MKDPIRCECGSLYYLHTHTVEEQTKCPDCRASLRREYEEQQASKRAGDPILTRRFK